MSQKLIPTALAFPIEDRTNGDMPDGNYLQPGFTKREVIAKDILCALLQNENFPVYENIHENAIRMADDFINQYNNSL